MARREPVQHSARGVRWRATRSQAACTGSQRDQGVVQTAPWHAVRRPPRRPRRGRLSAPTTALQRAGFVLAVAVVALSIAWLNWPGLPDQPKQDQPSILTADNPGQPRVVGRAPDTSESSNALLLAGASVVLAGGLLALRGAGRRPQVTTRTASEPDAPGDDVVEPLARPHVQAAAELRPAVPIQARSPKATAAGHPGGGHLPEPFRQAGTTATEPGSASASFSYEQAASEDKTSHALAGRESSSAFGRVPKPSPSPSLGERIYQRPPRLQSSDEPDDPAGS